MFRIVECTDLPVTNGACNPYAVVTLCYGKIRYREDVKRTNVKKKTICPQFEETFFFDVSTLVFALNRKVFNNIFGTHWLISVI
jgi:Ras GTPase-activating protein 3